MLLTLMGMEKYNLTQTAVHTGHNIMDVVEYTGYSADIVSQTDYTEETCVVH